MPRHSKLYIFAFPQHTAVKPELHHARSASTPLIVSTQHCVSPRSSTQLKTYPVQSLYKFSHTLLKPPLACKFGCAGNATECGLETFSRANRITTTFFLLHPCTLRMSCIWTAYSPTTRFLLALLACVSNSAAKPARENIEGRFNMCSTVAMAATAQTCGPKRYDRGMLLQSTPS